MKYTFYISFLVLSGVMLVFCSNKAEKQFLSISAFDATGSAQIVDEFQKKSDWITIYNASKDTVFLEGYYMSDDFKNLTKSRLNGGFVPPKSETILFATGKDSVLNHLAFKLDKKGGGIYLTRPDGKEVISEVVYSKQLSDYAMRNVKGNWLYYSSEENKQQPTYFTGISEEVKVEFKKGGNGKPTVQLSCEDEGNIRYTLNGTSALEEGALDYSEPIELDTHTVIRAANMNSELITISDIIRVYEGETLHDLPVISLITDPDNLWSNSKGIYVLGSFKNYDQRDESWIRSGEIEIKRKGQKLEKHKVDFKIYGAGTRKRPKKSLSILARDKMPNYFFTSTDRKSLDGFVMRACYSDASRFKNELVNGVNQRMNSQLLMQEYHPSVLYLNGEYWGLYNLSERKNDNFIKAHTGIKPTDLLNANIKSAKVEKGSAQHYNAVVDSLNALDMSTDEAFVFIENSFNVESLIDFWIQELYTLKADRFNNRFWRHEEKSPQWSYVGYDFDIGFVRPDSPRTHKNFEDAKAEGIAIFGRLMVNPEFSNKFFERLCDYMNFGYEKEVVTAILDKVDALTKEEFKRDYDRWHEEWSNNLDAGDYQKSKLIKFVPLRNDFLRDSIASKFGFIDQVIIKNPSPEKGKVLVNGFEVANESIYFTGMELHIEVQPHTDSSFNKWNGLNSNDMKLDHMFEEATIIYPNYH